jgi:putative transferase (TIGR04331 family)
MNSISGFLGRNDQIFILESYMEKRIELKLIKRLVGGFRFWQAPEPQPSSIPLSERKEIYFAEDSNEFPDLAKKLLPVLLPKIFVEDYCKLAKATRKQNWPISPRIIFTSNCHFNNEVFNHWCGTLREKNTILIVGEHGGFGTGKFNASGSFQLKCADLFLSTGWGDEKVNIKAVGNFRASEKKYNSDPNGKALLICVAMPKYSFDIRAMVTSSQMLNYFEDQFEFVDKLPKHIRGELIVRTYAHDYNWKQKERWKDRFPDIKIDTGSNKILSHVSNSRLFISTYNATTYLESFSLNIPTIIFWDPNYWELTHEAIEYFEELEKVGIFHKNPGKAAKFIETIWYDVDNWWNQIAVQEAKNRFCEKFCRSKPDILDRIEEILRNQI